MAFIFQTPSRCLKEKPGSFDGCRGQRGGSRVEGSDGDLGLEMRGVPFSDSPAFLAVEPLGKGSKGRVPTALPGHLD